MAEPTVTERVPSLRRELARVVAGLNPVALAPVEATRLLEEFSAMERLAAGAKVLLAQRARESGAWRAAGARSPQEWMARRTGTGMGQARRLLEASEAMSKLPVVAEAVRSGNLSQVQLTEIAEATMADPGAQSRLVETAMTQDVRMLKAACQATRAAAMPDDAARRERIRTKRSFRTWLDEEGAWCGSVRGPADAGARFMAAFEPHRERCFVQAREAGRRETFDAVAFDGLMAMAQGAAAGEGRPVPATVGVRVDRSALLRGHSVAGETCEIRGMGSVEVSVARAFMHDAFLVGLLVEGSDVALIKRFGRHIPAVVRDALAERDQICTEPGCSNTFRLQHDHIEPYRHTHDTSLGNLRRICPQCHRAKTNADRLRDQTNQPRGPDPPAPG